MSINLLINHFVIIRLRTTERVVVLPGLAYTSAGRIRSKEEKLTANDFFISWTPHWSVTDGIMLLYFHD